MDTRKLRGYWLFYVAAREKSISVAARILHMAQPPLSRQIAQLEEELGVKLFERTHKGVTLTSKGEALLPVCEKLFRKLDDFEAVVQTITRGAVGKIRIGAIPWITQSILPELIRRIRGQFPGVSVEVLQITSSQIPELLLNNSLDVCLGYLSSATREDLDVITARRFELVAIMPCWHRLTRYKTVSLSSLKKEKYVITEWSIAPEYHDAIVSQCLERGISLNIAIQTKSIFSQLCYVNSGSGIALIPKSSLSTLPPNVVHRELKEKLYMTLRCVTRREDDSEIVSFVRRYLIKG